MALTSIRNPAHRSNNGVVVTEALWADVAGISAHSSQRGVAAEAARLCGVLWVCPPPISVSPRNIV